SRSLPVLTRASHTVNSASTASRISTTAPTRTWFERVSIRPSFPTSSSSRPSGFARRMAGGHRIAAARAVEILLDPRMVQRQQLGNGADRDDTLVGEHGDAVADGVERVQIVRDQKHRQPERLLERGSEFVERGGADRIEPGG